MWTGPVHRRPKQNKYGDVNKIVEVAAGINSKRFKQQFSTSARSSCEQRTHCGV